MQMLLVLYKWQIAFVVSCSILVWPYVQFMVGLVGSEASRQALINIIIALAGLLALAYTLFTIWRDQQPKSRTSTK